MKKSHIQTIMVQARATHAKPKEVWLSLVQAYSATEYGLQRILLIVAHPSHDHKLPSR